MLGGGSFDLMHRLVADPSLLQVVAVLGHDPGTVARDVLHLGTNVGDRGSVVNRRCVAVGRAVIDLVCLVMAMLPVNLVAMPVEVVSAVRRLNVMAAVMGVMAAVMAAVLGGRRGGEDCE